MANMFDYLDWRGDLSFAQSPFNEVDNLILSQLVSVNLAGYVPAPGQPGAVSIATAAEHYFSGRETEQVSLGWLIPAGVIPLFKKLAQCVRFRGLLLSDYIDSIDEAEEKQFSALTVQLGDGSKYLAYCGTDDTLIGWKENLNMSFQEVIPAQKDALRYLHEAVQKDAEALRVGGHSKGGNLAVYAATHSEKAVKERILAVYSNDGPGFNSSMIDQPEYRAIRDRVHTIVPQSSIVGMLLEHEEKYKVVKSTGVGGVLQHDAFTWEVLGTGFVQLDSVTSGCRYFDETLKAWVDDMEPEKRREFIDALYEILASSGAETLTELTTDKLKTVIAVAGSLRSMDKETRDMLAKTLRLLFRESARFAPQHLRAGEKPSRGKRKK